MGKKVAAKPKSEKKKTAAQIRKAEKQKIIRTLQTLTKPYIKRPKSKDENIIRFTGDETQASSITERNSFIQQNANKQQNSDKNIVSDNKCYRCKHFLEIPQNLCQPFCKRTSSFVERCKADLTFVQAIIWLKSAIDCVSQISVEQLQLIFNRLQNIYGKRKYPENRHTNNIELKRSENKDLSMHKETNMSDTLTTLIPQNTINSPCIGNRVQYSTYKSRAISQDETQDDILSVLTDVLNESLGNELSTQESCAGCIMEDRNTLTDVLNLSLGTFGSPDLFDSEITRQDECPKLEKVERYLVQPASEDSIESSILSNREITRTTDNAGLDHVPSPSFFNNRDYKNVLPIQERDATVQINEQYKFVSPATNQSAEFYLLLDSNGGYFTPITSQFKLRDEFISPASYYSPKSLNLIQINTPPEINNDATFWKRQTPNNFQIEETPSNDLNNDETECEIQIDNPGGSNSQMSIKNPEWQQHDSAYSTSHIDVRNCDVEITKPAIDERKSGNNGCRYKSQSSEKETIMPEKKVIKHHYELRSYKKKMITRKEEVILQESEKARNCPKNQSGRKPEHEGDQVEKERRNEDETRMISAKWLSFTLDSLNVEEIILESLQVILSTLGHKKITEEYAMRRYWKDTLQEEAINAVLNTSDIFKIEEKSNICNKMIVTTIIQTFDEITTCTQFNKTCLWIYRLQIILELCNSLPICIETIDHLIEKLKYLESALTDAREIQKSAHATINQTHLMLYALNITLRKYRTVIPKDRKSRSAETTIPHVTDLWKTRYINEELEGFDPGFDLDAAEKRWSNTLEGFTVAATKYFVQFAEKSLLLTRILISQ